MHADRVLHKAADDEVMASGMSHDTLPKTSPAWKLERAAEHWDAFEELIGRADVHRQQDKAAADQRKQQGTCRAPGGEREHVGHGGWLT